jgi:DNA replication licensing factor MCM6
MFVLLEILAVQSLNFLSTTIFPFLFLQLLSYWFARIEWIMYGYHYRYTSSIVPRSVYTSGKSSSAAGLTATVAKEPETGEFCIEVSNLSLFCTC